jgi:hypothetical protein
MAGADLWVGRAIESDGMRAAGTAAGLRNDLLSATLVNASTFDVSTDLEHSPIFYCCDCAARSNLQPAFIGCSGGNLRFGRKLSG